MYSSDFFETRTNEQKRPPRKVSEREVLERCLARCAGGGDEDGMAEFQKKLDELDQGQPCY